MLTIDELIELAREVETEDPIDWAYLNVSEEDAYKLIAFSVMEQYESWKKTEHCDTVMLATIVKLIVENFVLNTKLLAR
jgi:hypothetical protein